MNSSSDEMRYWRNFAMQQGHERLNPSYISSAIRDICENDLFHSDRDDRQTRRPRTLHPPHAFTPYIPRAHASHGLPSDQPHPRASTPNRAPFPRPVVPPEDRVTPVIPFSTTRDQRSHPSFTPISHSFPGIQFHPLLQPPYHHSLPPYQRQPRSSHSPVYDRPTELDPVYPSRNPHQPSYPLVNEGDRTNSEPVDPYYRPQWRPPFVRDTPETQQAPRSSPAPTPELYAFRFPTRPLLFTPDLQPHPHVPEAAGWTGDTESGQEPGSGQQRPVPPPASALGQSLPDPYTATSAISPRRPPLLLGTTASAGNIPQWSPGTWPPMPWPAEVPVRLAPWLIPNPVNPNVPQLEWDVSLHPTTARRITGAHVTLPLDSAGGGSTGARIDHEPATSPASDRIVILCDVGVINQLWGPIVIERPGRRVTVCDLLEGIYAFFQTHLTRAEVERISSLGEDSYRLLVDAYRNRTTQRQLGVLRDLEWREGMRRVDCLGDGRWWWGAWVTYNSDQTWQLNLGLTNPAHRNT